MHLAISELPVPGTVCTDAGFWQMFAGWLDVQPDGTVIFFCLHHYINLYIMLKCKQISSYLAELEKNLCYLSLWFMPGALFLSRVWQLPVVFSSVQLSHSVVSDSLRPHGLQYTRLPCSSPTPRACSNPCPLSQWCHLTTSSSVIPFSSCLQSFPASGSFPMSQFFASGGQSFSFSISPSSEYSGLISLKID